MKTYAPSAMKRFVVARPMPLLPPVTKAILPASFCEVVFVVFVFMVLIRGLGDGCYPNLYICRTHLPLPDTSLLLGRVLNEELPHQPGDGVPVGLQGEVPGVEQVVFKRLHVSLVWLGSGGGEDLVVLAPNDQQRRLVLAEVLLPFRVQCRVAAVAEEQVELDFVVPLAV